MSILGKLSSDHLQTAKRDVWETIARQAGFSESYLSKTQREVKGMNDWLRGMYGAWGDNTDSMELMNNLQRYKAEEEALGRVIRYIG